MKIFILIISLFIGGQLYAAGGDIKEVTESWLQGSNRAPSSGGGLIDDDETPDGKPNTQDGAIHDGLYILLALTGAYILVRKKKKNLMIIHKAM